uniref:Death domain-containing protein n=1 Tax=Panagrellus redivivus TaxID=6233 RepID=A0A7E5A0B3_PANRE
MNNEETDKPLFEQTVMETWRQRHSVDIFFERGRLHAALQRGYPRWQNVESVRTSVKTAIFEDNPVTDIIGIMNWLSNRVGACFIDQ